MLRKRLIVCLGTAATALLAAVSAHAADAPDAINSGDTAWLLTSSALVLLMTAPGLALFTAAWCGARTCFAMLMQSFILAALVSIQWLLFRLQPGVFARQRTYRRPALGRTLRGQRDRAYPAYAATVPHQAFMIFQCMFAVITPALITGPSPSASRSRAFWFSACSGLTLIYDPLAHWVWGVDGWLHRLGALDFAGGNGGAYLLGHFGARRRAGDRAAARVFARFGCRRTT